MGEHQPLIEPSTWEAVQSILKVSPRMQGNNTRATITAGWRVRNASDLSLQTLHFGHESRGQF
ncbi:MAG: hypothetical protein EBT99_16890, partial [Betaproteobacteria bacterium]|nr:hypothetical protein [Betaproteobacteria bacterium]